MRLEAWSLALALVCSAASCRSSEHEPAQPLEPPRARTQAELELSQARDEALAWLIAHQSRDGRWDCDGFTEQCGQIGSGTCDGAGSAKNDVATTALAVLAVLGCEEKKDDPKFRGAVERAVRWLVFQQQGDTGRVGSAQGAIGMYGHGIAALAMAETYRSAKPFLLRAPAQRAVDFVARARNPYAAWRYDYPPSGDNDTSITGWMVLSLHAAQEGGLRVDESAFTGARSWFEQVTDPATGRCGYNALGTPSSRIPQVNDDFPPESGEAMTAVSILCRSLDGREPPDSPLLDKQVDLLRQKLPHWDPDGRSNDFYYWYYGTRALHRVGEERAWEPWSKSLSTALREAQVHEGDARGSWAPLDAWGFAGGRVYSTALLALCADEILTPRSAASSR